MRIARLLRLCLAIAIFAVAGTLLRDYVTDDTFIHLRYATHLVERGEFSFNPGEHTYGATSVVWVLGLALLLKIGLPPLYAAWVFGAASGLGVILLADAIIARLTFSDRWKTLVMIMVVSDVWFLRWTFSGMETPLATFILLLAMWPLFADRDLTWLETGATLWHRYLAWGVTAGLAGLIRPEFLVVVPVGLPVLLWFEYFRAGSVAGVPGRVRARPHAPLLAAAAGQERGMVVLAGRCGPPSVRIPEAPGGDPGSALGGHVPAGGVCPDEAPGQRSRAVQGCSPG